MSLGWTKFDKVYFGEGKLYFGDFSVFRWYFGCKKPKWKVCASWVSQWRLSGGISVVNGQQGLTFGRD